MEQRRLSLGNRPRRNKTAWRLLACSLALALSAHPALTTAAQSKGRHAETRRPLKPYLLTVRALPSFPSTGRTILAVKWETETTVHYDADSSTDRTDRQEAHERDQEERAWYMLENLSISPKLKKRPEKPKQKQPPEGLNRQPSPPPH